MLLSSSPGEKMQRLKKISPLLSIILCDFILLSLVVIGLDTRTKHTHKYMYVNTASFFYSRAHQLYEKGTYPKRDTTCFAPTVHAENYPPGLAYAGFIGYHLSRWIHRYNFFEFAVVFPVVMYLVILFAGYRMMARLYSRVAGLIFAALFTIMPAANKLTSPCYFTSESVGVLLFLLSIYFIIKIGDKPALYASLAVVSMSCFMLTWQLFLPILIITLIVTLTHLKSKTLIMSYAAVIIVPFIIGHVISKIFIGIDYSPFYVLKELIIGIKEGGTEAYSVAMRRAKLKPMGFEEYLKNFTWFAVPLLLVGLGVCIRFIKKVKYFVPLIGCLLGLVLICKYIKFRFAALPFILIVCGIGGEFLYNLGQIIVTSKRSK